MIHVINATSDHDSLILVLKKERQIAAFSVFGVCVKNRPTCVFVCMHNFIWVMYPGQL